MLDFSRYLKLDCLPSRDNPRQDTIKGVSLPRHFPCCLCNWTFIIEPRLYLAGQFPPQIYPYLLGEGLTNDWRGRSPAAKVEAPTWQDGEKQGNSRLIGVQNNGAWMDQASVPQKCLFFFFSVASQSCFGKKKTQFFSELPFELQLQLRF